MARSVDAWGEDWQPWGALTRDFSTLRQSLDYTIDEMTKFARTRSVHPEIRRIGIGLARGCPSKDYACIAESTLAWMRTWLRYVPDPPSELVQDPLFTLEVGGGDCDDLSPVFASILRSVGGKVAFATGSTSPIAVDPTHILPLIYIDGAWWPIEVSSASLPAGHFPPAFRLMETHQI